MTTTPFQLPVPTEDERTNALLVYVLSIFGGFLAPLIFFLVKKDSLFVKFHALQALIWHLAYMVVAFLAMMVMIVSVIFTIPMQPHEGKASAPPLAFFGFVGGFWLIIMGAGLFNLILAVVFAVKAHQGDWVRYPVIGNLALRGVLPNRPVS